MKFAVYSFLIAEALAGTVSLPIHKAKVNVTSTNSTGSGVRHDKRDDTAPESLVWQDGGYFATIYVGSDRQKVTPQIDTGSSDLWLMAPSNPYCSGSGGFDCSGQTYDPSTSTTFKNLSEPFDIKYMDTTGAFGYLVEDSVQIDSDTVTNFEFGFAQIANSSTDVLGVGYVDDEAEYYSNSYPNFPIQLKNQGFIERAAYSLYLNDLQAGDGEILFGGVDHAKYTGELGLVQTVGVDFNTPNSFSVILNSISAKSGSNACPLASMQLPVVLDSGTTYAVLPQDIIASMASAMGYSYNDQSGYYQGSCSGFGFDSFELDFSGIKLQVPPASLTAQSSNNGWFGFGSSECILAIDAGQYLDSLILGDVFLRNLYVVYDLESYHVALAQTKFNESDDSDVEEIVSSIPSATTAPGYSSTQWSKSFQTYANFGSCVSN